MPIQSIINTENIERAKKEIEKADKPIIIKAQSLEFNRKILEYGKFNILLDIHETTSKDKIKQLASGLNHILTKIAKKNKVAIGIDLNTIRKLQTKQKAQALARIKQNIKIARKTKTKITLINQKDNLNAQSLLLSLQASTQQAKESIVF